MQADVGYKLPSITSLDKVFTYFLVCWYNIVIAVQQSKLWVILRNHENFLYSNDFFPKNVQEKRTAWYLVECLLFVKLMKITFFFINSNVFSQIISI